MYKLLCVSLLLSNSLAFATNTTSTAPQTLSQNQQQYTSSTAAAQANTHVSNSSMETSQDSYRNNMFVLPGSVVPYPAVIPPGLCNTSYNKSFSILFGALTMHSSAVNESSRTYVDCMKEVVPLMTPRLVPTKNIHPPIPLKKKHRKMKTLLDCSQVKQCMSKENK